MKDFYYILGTDENCTYEELKAAYRKLSKKFHPDVNGNDGYFESRFKDLQEAFETLSDPALRRRYDAALKKSRLAQSVGQEPKRKVFRATTGIDILFSIVLIIITFVFGDYVMKAISGEKLKKPELGKTVAVNNIITAVPKHRKKKRIINSWQAKASPSVTVNYAAQPLKPPTAAAKPVTAASPVLPRLVPAGPSVTDSDKVMQHKSFLYATYIKSNITGVINMHKLDNYGSAIVKVIPNNSKVFVLEKGGIYYKVLFEHASGYVPKWTLAAN